MAVGVIALALLWIGLSQKTGVLTLLAGLLALAAVVVIQRLLFPSIRVFPISLLRRPDRLIAFLALLFVRFVASTLYTSRLIIMGNEEGRIVALPVKIKDPLGQFVLLNSITLTPSTISLLLEGNLLYIHWLRGRGDAGDWNAIKESLERSLAALYDRRKSADR